METKDRNFVAIDEELKNSYLTYAMSVIVSRALPDARDGLKPSQRRIMVAMNDLNLGPKAKYRKCAKIAGDTSGNYHPHGEGVIYPTLVRLAQPFNMRYPLIDGQGNFGSLDGDPPAAMRYTEARMTAVAMEMLEDLELETVDFVSNYDETRNEPVVLPSKFPNLLVNGTMGIAVGMATSLPSNNLGEVCNGILKFLENPDITPFEMCKIIQGPDFPTGAIICGRGTMEKAYCTGRGTITIRSKVDIVEHNNRSCLIFTEIPYQINKARILENIAELVKEDKITGVHDVRDESDREHEVRIVVELKRGENAEVVLNQLYKFTSLQSSYSINMIALVAGRPQLLNIKELVKYFVQHRYDVIRRRTQFLLKKAEARLHIVNGLMLAIQNIDDVIVIIRHAQDLKQARENLITRYQLTTIQTDAILQTRLSTLTTLEYGKLQDESNLLNQNIIQYNKMLTEDKEIRDIIRQETLLIKEKYSTPRKTNLGESIYDIETEDIIPNEPWLVLVTNRKYIKRTALDLYKVQQRGGKGVIGADLQEGDFVEHFFVAFAHDSVLFFSDQGKVYSHKVYEIPEFSRNSKGRALVNFLQLGADETITSLIPIDKFNNRFLMMITANGIIKKSKLEEFSRPKKDGLRAILLQENDHLIATRLTNGEQEIVIGTAQGKAIHFHEKNIRFTGRASHGIIACKLAANDKVIGMVVVTPQESLLTVCQNGLVKRSSYEHYRLTKRGAQGVTNYKVDSSTGPVVSILSVKEDDEIMVITSQGMVIRTNLESIRVKGRVTHGVKLISLKPEHTVVSVTKLAREILPDIISTPPTPIPQPPQNDSLQEMQERRAKDQLYNDEEEKNIINGNNENESGFENSEGM